MKDKITGVYSGDCEFREFLRDRAAGRINSGKTELRALSLDECLAKAARVKLFLLDVDGVLTDGSITYNDAGDEIKTFNCRDGFGLNILQKIGVKVGIISARKSGALTRRAKDLSLEHVFQGARNKVAVFTKLIEDLNITPSETAYMGDDWLDLSLLSRVGFAATVADGDQEVKNNAHYVAQARGGMGAVREVCELIIHAKGKRQDLLKEYLERC